MKEYNDIIINKLYQEISSEYNQNLKKYNVIMPNLYKGVKYTISALVLIYLYDHIRQIVSKQELTDFLRSMGYEINDMQQARHLAQQSGWYILSGTRGDYECRKLGIKAGEYMLKTIKEPYPSYKKLKRTEKLNANSWEELKKIYNNRCATCGSARLDANKPSTTITRNFACISSSRCIHPYLNRGLTAREAARIQSYPDTYIFLGSKTDIHLQIGNSVPPILAEQIANTIIEMLNEVK